MAMVNTKVISIDTDKNRKDGRTGKRLVVKNAKGKAFDFWMETKLLNASEFQVGSKVTIDAASNGTVRAIVLPLLF